MSAVREAQEHSFLLLGPGPGGSPLPIAYPSLHSCPTLEPSLHSTLKKENANQTLSHAQSLCLPIRLEEKPVSWQVLWTCIIFLTSPLALSVKAILCSSNTHQHAQPQGLCTGWSHRILHLSPLPASFFHGIHYPCLVHLLPTGLSFGRAGTWSVPFTVLVPAPRTEPA